MQKVVWNLKIWPKRWPWREQVFSYLSFWKSGKCKLILEWSLLVTKFGKTFFGGFLGNAEEVQILQIFHYLRGKKETRFYWIDEIFFWRQHFLRNVNVILRPSLLQFTCDTADKKSPWYEAKLIFIWQGFRWWCQGGSKIWQITRCP